MRAAKGFTLIEILVVMVIISIITGITVANMPQLTQTADFDEETRRIKLLLEMALDEAVVLGTEIGFKVEDDGYRFLQYDETGGGWQALETAPFKPRTLPENIELILEIDGEPLELVNISGSNSSSNSTNNSNKKSSKPALKKQKPDLLILSSGETTPFEMTVTQSDNLSMTLKTEGYGVFSWVEDEKR